MSTLKRFLESAAVLAALCLLLSASAQSPSYACQSISMGQYASFSFCLPSNATSTQGSSYQADYAGGRDVGASFFINGSAASLDLLYPCQIGENLTRTQIISALKTYDSHLSQAFYSTDEAEVNDKNAVFGSYGNGSFVAFQPSTNTVAALFFSGGVGMGAQAKLLSSLELVVNETATPLTPNYCSQINSNSTGNGIVAGMPSASSVSPPMTIISQVPMQPQQPFFRGMGPGSEARMTRIEAALESLNSALEASQEKLGQTKENLTGQSETTLEKLGSARENLGSQKGATKEKLGQTKENLTGQSETTLEKLGSARENLGSQKGPTLERLGAAMEGLKS
jgi:hypothetical protein